MNDLRKKITIFPIEITKIFVRMSKMENVKTFFGFILLFFTLFVALRIKLSEAAQKVS